MNSNYIFVSITLAFVVVVVPVLNVLFNVELILFISAAEFVDAVFLMRRGKDFLSIWSDGNTA